VASGATVTPGSRASPASTSASGTASGIVVPPLVSLSTWGLRLLLRVGVIAAIYIPSTTVASGGVASAPGATVSPWGREADSSTVGDKFSSVAVVLGSSPSQERSVDFLHSTKLVVNQVRLPSYKYYSRMFFTYKLDQTTVTVGVPSMMAISMSPASAAPPLQPRLLLVLRL
jgi:hypothetical protein